MRPTLFFACLAAWALLAGNGRAQALHERLANVADFEEIDDPQMTLEQFLNNLTRKLGIPFVVNEHAFMEEGIAKPLKQPVSEEKIPAHKGVRIDRYLKRVLDGIRLQQSGAPTWMIRRDAIEITSALYARAEIYGPAEHRGPFLPLVHGRFEKKPLAEVLPALAEQADYNVLLDGRAGEQARTTVSARLANVPLDAAVSLLADSADLAMYRHGNVLYVTTRESAAAWEKRRQGESVRPEVGPPAPGPMPSTVKGEMK